MPKSLEDSIASKSPERQAGIKADAERMIADEGIREIPGPPGKRSKLHYLEDFGFVTGEESVQNDCAVINALEACAATGCLLVIRPADMPRVPDGYKVSILAVDGMYKLTKPETGNICHVETTPRGSVMSD